MPRRFADRVVAELDLPSLVVERGDLGRWVALGIDEVKAEMLDRQEAIRSRRPAGIAQELWGIALAYNLVRLEMVRMQRRRGLLRPRSAS